MSFTIFKQLEDDRGEVVTVKCNKQNEPSENLYEVVCISHSISTFGRKV